jgi:hypothetical protein
MTSTRHLVQSRSQATNGAPNSWRSSSSNLIVSSHHQARARSLADVADNSDPSRLALLPTVDHTRLQKKYAETLQLLGER